jgi:hypothetical protein
MVVVMAPLPVVSVLALPLDVPGSLAAMAADIIRQLD